MANKDNLKNRVKFGSGQDPTKGGRPRKLVSATLKALNDVGIIEVTKQEVISTYMSLINCTESDLKEMMNDDDQSILVKTVCKEIAKGKGFDIIEKMLDRAIGKPKQDIGIQVDPEVLPLNFLIDGVENK